MRLRWRRLRRHHRWRRWSRGANAMVCKHQRCWLNGESAILSLTVMSARLALLLCCRQSGGVADDPSKGRVRLHRSNCTALHMPACEQLPACSCRPAAAGLQLPACSCRTASRSQSCRVAAALVIDSQQVPGAVGAVMTRRLFCTRSKLEEAKEAAAAALINIDQDGGDGAGGLRAVRSAPQLGRWGSVRGAWQRSPTSGSPSDRWTSSLMSFR